MSDSTSATSDIRRIGLNEFDSAMIRIEQAARAGTQKCSTGISEGQIAIAETKVKPTIKPRKVIKPAEMVGSAFLETLEAANAFVDRLRDQMLEAIKNGQRIEIR